MEAIASVMLVPIAVPRTMNTMIDGENMFAEFRATIADVAAPLACSSIVESHPNPSAFKKFISDLRNLNIPPPRYFAVSFMSMSENTKRKRNVISCKNAIILLCFLFIFLPLNFFIFYREIKSIKSFLKLTCFLIS